MQPASSHFGQEGNHVAFEKFVTTFENVHGCVSSKLTGLFYGYGET